MATKKAKPKATKRKAKTAKPVDVSDFKKSESERLHAESCLPGTFTAEKKKQFLDLYRHGGSVRTVAHEIGVSAVTVYNAVKRDEKFAKEYSLALEANTDALEDRLYDMALLGNVAALFGTLKARRPERWRDNFQAKVTVEHTFTASFATAMQQEMSSVVSQRQTH